MTNVKSSNRYTGGLACRDIFLKTKMAHAKTRKHIFRRTGLPEYLLEHPNGSAETKNKYSGGVICQNIFLKSNIDWLDWHASRASASIFSFLTSFTGLPY